jgi:acetylornithine deacetylase/succinyl-diaminopimelate desuccinylase-like protein
VEPKVFESSPGRGSLVARLRGTGELPPLLLMSHLDVVPAEAACWEHPPFAAEVHDGYVWGRGALDCKGLASQHLTVLLLCQQMASQGHRLRRDLILMATADEEVGGSLGAQWLVDNHPDAIRAEYALNEGGGATFVLAERPYMTVQTAEKGLARFTLLARGPVGHASMPRDDNAVVLLAEAVASVGRARLPAHLTATIRERLLAMADTQAPDVARDLRTMVDEPTRIDDLLARLPLDAQDRRQLYAATHNTAAPTMLSAGSKVNVFPSVATARVDGRTLPGFAQADLLAELEPYIPAGVEVQFDDDAPPLEADVASPLLDAIRAAVAARAPDVTLLPELLTGGTDAKAVVRLGTRVYGFGPQRYEAEVAGLPLVHGHNERISLENLTFGAQVLFEVVSRFCS